jgi:nucleoid DNA-binding protein
MADDNDTIRATRQDLIEYVAKHHGIPLAEAKQLVFTMLSGIVWLADHSDYLMINGFGRFENRQRKGRVHTNLIQGGEKVIPPSTVLWFTAAKGLKQPLDEPLAEDAPNE